MTKKEKRVAREEAIDYLKNVIGLKAGDTVHTVTTRYARSGMSRWIRFFVLRIDSRDGKPYAHDISRALGHVLDLRYSDGEGVRISGYGMDMGFWGVYHLAEHLFAETGVRAGYELNHRWL